MANISSDIRIVHILVHVDQRCDCGNVHLPNGQNKLMRTKLVDI